MMGRDVSTTHLSRYVANIYKSGMVRGEAVSDEFEVEGLEEQF